MNIKDILIMESSKINCYCKSNSANNSICTMACVQCCWCSDKRTKYKIYVDEYGLIEPIKYHHLMPIDLYYCSGCKHPDTISVGCYTEQLKNILPEPNVFHEQETKAKKNIKIQMLIRMEKKKHRKLG